MKGGGNRRERYGVWVYSPMEDVMAEAGLQEVDTHIYFLHKTVEQLIATRPIIDLCLEAERIPGPRVSNRWW